MVLHRYNMWIFIDLDPPDGYKNVFKINIKNWQKIKSLQGEPFVNIIKSLNAFNGEIL